MAEGGVISKGIGRVFQKKIQTLLMKIRNRTGPNILPWGTPASTGRDEKIPLKAAVSLESIHTP